MASHFAAMAAKSKRVPVATKAKRIPAASVGVEAIVLRVDRDVSAGHIYCQCFDALITLFDHDRAVGDRHGRVGVDSVITCRDRNVTSGNGDFAGRVNAVV